MYLGKQSSMQCNYTCRYVLEELCKAGKPGFDTQVGEISLHKYISQNLSALVSVSQCGNIPRGRPICYRQAFGLTFASRRGVQPHPNNVEKTYTMSVQPCLNNKKKKSLWFVENCIQMCSGPSAPRNVKQYYSSVFILNLYQSQCSGPLPCD